MLATFSNDIHRQGVILISTLSIFFFLKIIVDLQSHAVLVFLVQIYVYTHTFC